MWPISAGHWSALAAAFVLAPATAAAVEAPSVSALLVPQGYASNDASLFHQPELGYAGGQDSLRTEFGIRWRADSLNFTATPRVTRLEGGDAEAEGIVNEAYWNGALRGQYFTVGKKIMSWDVGFGFRPLDVLQRDDRRVLLASTYEGNPVLAWDWFGDRGALTLVYANPDAGRADEPRDDESVAARYFLRFDDLDLHAIGRFSERFGLEGGLATTAVFGESLEVHGSFRYQQRQERALNRLAEDPGAPPVAPDPLARIVERGRVAALVGGTWSESGGTSVLAEWWHDSAAYAVGEWRRLLALAREQAALIPTGSVPIDAVAGAFAANFAYLRQANLLRHNVLLRASHRRDTFEPSIDLLWTPEDGGAVLTLSASNSWDRQRLSVGARAFEGAEGSVFAELPDRHVVYCAWEVAW